MLRSHSKAMLKKENGSLVRCPSCGFFLPRVFCIKESKYKVTVPLGQKKMVYVDSMGIGRERADFACDTCCAILKLRGGRAVAQAPEASD